MANVLIGSNRENLIEKTKYCDLTHFFKPCSTSTQQTPFQIKNSNRQRKRTQFSTFEHDISFYWRKKKRNKTEIWHSQNKDVNYLDNMNSKVPTCDIVWADDTCSEKITIINFKPRQASSNNSISTLKENSLSNDQIKQMDIILDNLINFLKLDNIKVKPHSQFQNQTLNKSETKITLTQPSVHNLKTPVKKDNQDDYTANQIPTHEPLASLTNDTEDELNDEDDWLTQITDDFLLEFVKIGSDGVVSEGLLKAKQNIPVPFEPTSLSKSKNVTKLNTLTLPKPKSQNLQNNLLTGKSNSENLVLKNSCSTNKLEDKKILKSKNDSNQCKAFTEVTNFLKPILKIEPNQACFKKEPISNPSITFIKDDDTFEFDDDGDEIIKNMDIDHLMSQENVKVNLSSIIKNESMDLETLSKTENEMDDSVLWDDECDIICSNI